jgi:hypothetical protein
MLSKRSASDIFHLNAVNTHFTEGKALLQNQWAGGPGGIRLPLLPEANEVFWYNTARTTTNTTTPAA